MLDALRWYNRTCMQANEWRRAEKEFQLTYDNVAEISKPLGIDEIQFRFW